MHIQRHAARWPAATRTAAIAAMALALTALACATTSGAASGTTYEDSLNEEERAAARATAAKKQAAALEAGDRPPAPAGGWQPDRPHPPATISFVFTDQDDTDNWLVSDQDQRDWPSARWRPAASANQTDADPDPPPSADDQTRPVAHLSTLHGGFSGAALAADARILPPGVWQTAAGAYAVVDPAPGAVRARLPSWAGLAMGGFFIDQAELTLSWMYTGYLGYAFGAALDGLNLMASLKTSLLDTRDGAGPQSRTGATGQVAAAVLVRVACASYAAESSAGWPPSWDGPNRFPGAGAGLVLEWCPGPFRLYANGELTASTFYPGWGDGAWAVPGFFAWPGVRITADSGLDLGPAGMLALTVSGAVRGQPIGTPAGWRPPLAMAAELAWYPPDTPLMFQAHAVGEWQGASDWQFATGLAVAAGL